MNSLETIAVVPAFNEAKRIELVMRAICAARLVDGLVVVDDGSSDGTAQTAELAMAQAEEQGRAKPFELVRQAQNQGKTEAMRTGVDHAQVLGREALRTVVFLDADSSPIWSRDTKGNMKLWQRWVTSLCDYSPNLLSPDIMADRQPAFVSLLAQYIDEIVGPVADGQQLMRTGMYQRNFVTDTLLGVVDKSQNGGHAGNRAVPLEVWKLLIAQAETNGVTLSGWKIEAALNAFLEDQPTGTRTMYGVVNVGSRVKAGGMSAGIKRMIRIHGQTPLTRRQIQPIDDQSAKAILKDMQQASFQG